MSSVSHKSWAMKLSQEAAVFQLDSPFIIRDMWGKTPKRVFWCYFDHEEKYFVLAIYSDSFDDPKVYISATSMLNLVKIYCEEYEFKTTEPSSEWATWVEEKAVIGFKVKDPDFPNADRVFDEDE